MARNRFPQTLSEVAANGLCSGCGLCQSVTGGDRVRMVPTSKGYERPLVRRGLPAPLEQRALAACPGARIVGPAVSPSSCDPVWGHFRSMVAVRAADPAVRAEASSGGALSALAIHLLRTGQVAQVLHVAASRVRPMRSSSHLSGDMAGVLRGGGARLGPVAMLSGLIALLDRKEPFAIIGKPCDINAVHNLARVDDRVDRFCRYRLSMLCAGAPGWGATLDRLAGVGIGEDALTRVTYRTTGSVARSMVDTRDGRRETLLFDLATEATLPYRCRVCPDGIGCTADLVAADRITDQGDVDGNVVIARSDTGLDLLSSAIGEEALVFEGEYPAAELSARQPYLVRQRHRVWARLVALANAGRPVPEVAGIGIENLARRNGLGANLTEVRRFLRELLAGGGLEAPVRHTGGF